MCCPFHSDNDPSMKLNDTYYYCFACGANGDAIDLTAKLFDLNPRQAAEKLASDFGLDPDKPPANAIALPPPKRGLTDEQWADIAYCLRVPVSYTHLASGSAHWPRTSSVVDGRFSWVSKGAAAPLWHTTLLAKSSVLHLGSG